MRSNSKRDFDTCSGSARSSKKKVEFKSQLVDPRPERRVSCPPSMMDDNPADGDYVPVDDTSSFGRFKGYRRGFSCQRSARSAVRQVARTLCAAYYFVTRRRDDFE
jgi:hypothetical protein